LVYDIDLEPHVTKLLSYCRLSHDGDRALVDYRRPIVTTATNGTSDHSDEKTIADVTTPTATKTVASPAILPMATSNSGFHATPWGNDRRSNASDDMIDEWIRQETDLIDTPGAFERYFLHILITPAGASAHMDNDAI
jgi:hypothetical protein